MNVYAIPLDDFVHDDWYARRGQGIDLDESLARDLQYRGLVEVGAWMVPDAHPPITGKWPAVGEEQPSSVLPAAQALPEMTANAFESGEKRKRKGA